jgi:hypothetical protein
MSPLVALLDLVDATVTRNNRSALVIRAKNIRDIHKDTYCALSGGFSGAPVPTPFILASLIGVAGPLRVFIRCPNLIMMSFLVPGDATT